MKRYYSTRLISTLLGTIAGYIVVHPYTMLIYVWAHVHPGGPGTKGLSLEMLYSAAFKTFQPVMLPMALSFMVLGGLMGFLVGSLIEKRRGLLEAQLEDERKRVAFETLHQLMVTLSHYLLNADTIISGMARHCRKKTGLDKDTLDALAAIEGQARKVEAVVRALQRVSEIKTTPYTADSRTLMLDVTKELEAELRADNPVVQ